MIAFHISTIDQLIPEVLTNAGRCRHMKPDLILSQGAQVIVAFQSPKHFPWYFLDEYLARKSWIVAVLQLNHGPEIGRHQAVHRVHKLTLHDVPDGEWAVLMDRLFGAHRAFREQDRRHDGALGDHHGTPSTGQATTLVNSNLKQVYTQREA